MIVLKLGGSEAGNYPVLSQARSPCAESYRRRYHAVNIRSTPLQALCASGKRGSAVTEVKFCLLG
jgi:hypothetical protein